MEYPLISVIIPVFNVERFLVRCLESLTIQSYPNIEFLLIDDGSTDNSGVICRNFAQKDSRFRYLYQENSGVSAARNLGLREARGEYFGFCDSDDWAEPDLYETLYHLALDNQADISVVSCMVEEPNGTVAYADSDTCYLMTGREALVEMHKAEKFAGQMWNKLIKRELLQNEMFSQEIAIYEDILLMGELFARAQRVVYRNVHKYHYVIHNQSALNRGMNEKHWTVQLACRLLVEQMERCNPKARNWAVYTLLIANVHLLNKLHQSKKLNSENFERVMTEIRKFDCVTVQALLPKGYRYQITAARVGRTCYQCYYRMTLLSAVQKIKAAIRGLLAKGRKGA